MRGFENVPSDWAPAKSWLVDGFWFTTIEFIVPGQPIQQGNIIKNRYGNLYDKTKGLTQWRAAVSVQAKAAMVGNFRQRNMGGLLLNIAPFDGAVLLDVTFVRDRPKSMTKKSTPQHITFPDLSKLVRAAEDSLTGIVWGDDKQVVETNSRKRWADVGEAPGAHILVTTDVRVN